MGEGFNVYLLGWDVPESEDCNLSFEILNARDFGLMCSSVAAEEQWPRVRDWPGSRLGERT